MSLFSKPKKRTATNLQIVTGDDSNYYGVYDDPDGTSPEPLIISFTAEVGQPIAKEIEIGLWYLISSSTATTSRSKKS